MENAVTLVLFVAACADERKSTGVTSPGKTRPEGTPGKPSSIAIKETICDPQKTEEITVNPVDGAVRVNASPEHPSLVVVNAKTPGENNMFKWRPTGTDVPWQTANAANDPAVATILLTSVGIEVDTREGRGFWVKVGEPTPNAGVLEVASREQDSFQKSPRSTRITEIIVDRDGKGYATRTLPKETNPYNDSAVLSKHIFFA